MSSSDGVGSCSVFYAKWSLSLKARPGSLWCSVTRLRARLRLDKTYYEAAGSTVKRQASVCLGSREIFCGEGTRVEVDDLWGEYKGSVSLDRDDCSQSFFSPKCW